MPRERGDVGMERLAEEVVGRRARVRHFGEPERSQRRGRGEDPGPVAHVAETLAHRPPAALELVAFSHRPSAATIPHWISNGGRRLNGAGGTDCYALPSP